jgi:hypothetical protein
MARLFSVLGLAALTAYSYAQYTSWSLFDSVAHQQPMRSSASQGRAFHK